MTMRTPRGRASLALITAALVGAGCQPGDGPAAPVALRCPTARVPLCTDRAQATAVRAAAADAELRLVPALESASSRDVFAQRLTVVTARLGSGDVSGARTALVAARGALADSRAQLSTNPGDAADLSAIELTLDQIAAVLGDS